MRWNLLHIAASICVFTGIGLAQSAAPAKTGSPSAESVIQRSIEVTGGKAAYDAVKTEMSTGSFSIASAGIKGTITEYSASPGKAYASIDMAGVGKMEEGTDGKVAWENSALQGPRLLSGDEAALAFRKAASDAVTSWQKYYNSAEVTGTETIEGKTCYKVLMKPKVGSPETDYYDKETGFLVRQSSTTDTPMGPIPAETTFSDYRKQGDLLLAFHVVQRMAGQQFDIELQKIELNASIPDSRFDPPGEVKALIK